MMRLSGKRAFITGASRGIGRAITESFLTEGASVIACSRGERPTDLPKSCDWQTLDVSDSTQVQKLSETLGVLDILVNNAGVQIEKTVVDSTDDDWESVIGVNSRGVFNMCRAFIPKMSKGGSIINIGSISGNVSDSSMALYNASKSFVHSLTRSIAIDHGPDIRCNAICPGWINTGMLESSFDLSSDSSAARRDAILRHPVGRFGQPADIASMAIWLAGDESSFATGQLFTIDGGMTSSSPLNPGLF